MKLCDLKAKLDNLLKVHLAYDWDNVGLCIGSLDEDISSITLSLELCDEVIDDAIKNKSNMIILHHPLIFSGIKNIVDSDHKQKMLIKLIKNNIALYVAHTNFDIIEGGLNDYIINLFSVEKVQPLTDDYDINTLGRVAVLKEPISLKKLVYHIQEKLNAKNIRIISKENKIIRKIALVTGAGDEFADIALQRADVFITGDTKYHFAQDSYQKGDCIIDASHYDTEKFFPDAMKKFLEDKLDNIDFYISNKLKAPFNYVEDYYE